MKRRISCDLVSVAATRRDEHNVPSRSTGAVGAYLRLEEQVEAAAGGGGGGFITGGGSVRGDVLNTSRLK
jgi:hypothetical protein